MMENILTIIACHTDSIIKINALIHNLKYFMEISNDIIIINSLEFINLNLEKKMRKKYDHLRKLDDGKIGNKKNKIYFDYKENDKYICHGKFIYYLNKIDYGKYTHIILTNDSILITRPLIDFKNLFDKNSELIALLDSNEIKYHYPDFLRAYNYSGIKKILKYYEEYKNKITDVTSIIIHYEINSSDLFKKTKILYKNEKNYMKNIHFDNLKLEDYLYNKNYPVIKIKKLQQTKYNKIPDDFDPKVYKNLHKDLCNLSDIDAHNHFIKYGMHEGKIYKMNQKIILPNFLEKYTNLIKFKI